MDVTPFSESLNWNNMHIEIYQFNNYQVQQSVVDFYHHLHPLHNICLNPTVTVDGINNCIISHHGTDFHDGMIPLHIVAINPHADTGSIVACFHAITNGVFSQDSIVGGELHWTICENTTISRDTLRLWLLCVYIGI